MNKLNNTENVEDANNIEHSGQDNESPSLEDPSAHLTPSPNPPPPTHIGVEESQRDQGQKVVIHVSASGVTPSINSSKEEYPVNTDAVPHSSPCHLPRNDSQLVTGSDPPSNGTLLAQAQNDASNINSSPSLYTAAAASPNNTDPIFSDNRVTEVTTTHQDASDDRDCPCDLVTPEIKPTVLPNRSLQSNNATSPETGSVEECGGESVRTLNPPNGLVFRCQNHNNATL